MFRAFAEEKKIVGYTLVELAGDIRRELGADPGPAAKAAVCRLVARALTDAAFVAAHLKDRPAGGHPREVLYEDPELGFCICGHVYPKAALGAPHDHGSSWAIYGQAAGVTEMTEWRIVEKAENGGAVTVEPVETYVMNPGDVRLYDVGVVHSPRREAPVKLIRIEGRNLDHIERSNIRAKEPVAS
jgi:hypothetical protein